MAPAMSPQHLRRPVSESPAARGRCSCSPLLPVEWIGHWDACFAGIGSRWQSGLQPPASGTNPRIYSVLWVIAGAGGGGSHLDRDRADRMRTAGQGYSLPRYPVRDAAVMDHMHLAAGLADLASAAKPEGAAGRNVQPVGLGDRQHGVGLVAFGGDARGRKVISARASSSGMTSVITGASASICRTGAPKLSWW